MTSPADDDAFCAAVLPRVSRTFALAIELLPEPARSTVRTAYLLCRIADAAEDQTTASIEARGAALGAFRRELRAAGLEAGTDREVGVPDELIRAPQPLGADDVVAWPEIVAGHGEHDVTLVRERERVLRCLTRLPRDERALLVGAVDEMALGMREFLRRPIGSVADLEAYCHFVAGTVGQLLTGIFAENPVIDEARRKTLAAEMEGFGVGLQLVNVVKDAAGDWREGRVFLPTAMGTPPVGRALTDRERAFFDVPIRTLARRARRRLEGAHRYVLALPAAMRDARVFCALPLHLAWLTLRAGDRAPTWLDADRPVKITRDEVQAAAAWVLANAHDDAALEARKRELTA